MAVTPSPRVPANGAHAQATSIERSFKPYYSPFELRILTDLQSGQIEPAAPAEATASTSAAANGSTAATPQRRRKTVSRARVEVLRQLACGLIERVGLRLGLPRRTIATAQSLYHRFHLTYAYGDFAFQDVSISCMLVACKVEDTLKKLREIQIASWQVMNILEGGAGAGEGDVAGQEAHRPHLIAIERLVLETICFNFHLQRMPHTAAAGSSADSIEAFLDASVRGPLQNRDAFAWVLRIGRSMHASRAYTLVAYLLAIDAHRTLAPLSYPPHTIALACVYLASYLVPAHPNSRTEAATSATLPKPAFEHGWCESFESAEANVHEVCHMLLDLLISLLPSSGTFANTSPGFSPSTPSPADSAAVTGSTSGRSGLSERDRFLLKAGTPHVFDSRLAAVAALSEEELTRVKVRLRAKEHAHPNGAANGGQTGESARKRARPQWRTPLDSNDVKRLSSGGAVDIDELRGQLGIGDITDARRDMSILYRF